jgi:hypothetical protein
MTATPVKTKKIKSAPFQSKPRTGRGMQLPPSSTSLAISLVKEQERLSDWDHAS